MMKVKKKVTAKSIFRSKFFLIGGIILVILISISLTKEILRRIEINREIAQLEKEIKDLEEKNAELVDLIQYLNSTSWQEKEARTKLNLKKKGETMVVIPPANETEDITEKIVITEPVTNLSNPQKWWNYFIN